jgi:hypothetical protein
MVQRSAPPSSTSNAKPYPLRLFRQIFAVGSYGGPEAFAEMIPPSLGPPTQPESGEREEAFLRLIRFSVKTRTTRFEYHGRWSLAPELASADAPRNVNARLLASLGNAYRVFKYAAGTLEHSDHDTDIIKKVVDILLAVGVAYRRQDGEFLNQVSEKCTDYLIKSGLRSPRRSDALRSYHNTVGKSLEAYATSDPARSEAGIDGFCERLIVWLDYDDALKPLQDELLHNRRVRTSNLPSIVPALRKVVSGIALNPTDDHIEVQTQKLVRAVMRELGMPPKRVNALYDADRKADMKAKKKRRSHQNSVASGEEASFGDEGARPADRGTSSR